MSRKIVDIEGIGPVYAEKLNGIGILTVADLLASGRTPGGRARIAAGAGVPDAKVLTWVNHADLMRVKGIGPQYAELLEASGVDSVKELRNRNAANLAARMEQVMNEKGITRTSPAPKMAQGWIDRAGQLEGAVEH